MLAQELPQCAICNCSIIPSEPLLDFTPFGIGYTHAYFCEPEARELAYERFADANGLKPVDGQCLHGVGEAWTYKQYEKHAFWGCPLEGRVPYRVLDHQRMWVVQEGSSWSSVTEPGLKIVTSEPYLSEALPIASASWLWYELGSEFLEFRYDDISIHRPAVDGSPRTALRVWARPGVGDTDGKREWRKDFKNRRKHPRRHE
ncbi:MAG: hypothetical protein U9R47_05380 [Actinomycetota bacterium]|nr:hypothetical protein [Actinomycetota bacterium]